MLGLPVALAACSSAGRRAAPELRVDPYYQSIYGSVVDNGNRIPAVDLRRVDPRFWRQEVDYAGSEAPGTIVVDTPSRFLYLVQAGGRAMRYGVGVGREEALQFRGTATIGRKAVWPRWTPTQNMIRREPERYRPYADGLPGGITNPLGARALYLYRNGRDTLFRIHGTTEPYTIGTNVSSGCIRLMNQDIIDLHSRVPSGTRVIVRQ
ncbi:hypothetical protein GCM10007989_15130 [Devosia pacifica]|uniref:L,D-TPase catalytic domain-containing protein n=2 Tax=Devosia pacifica TaxID=1335967 RepID=A0A918VTB8_9HYPH|nr:L,D-transpeptidase [Devosia pacifica]GHA20939.1 hypothetical protein GCM10007989_15130 [Devosia pacifica]